MPSLKDIGLSLDARGANVLVRALVDYFCALYQATQAANDDAISKKYEERQKSIIYLLKKLALLSATNQFPDDPEWMLAVFSEQGFGEESRLKSTLKIIETSSMRLNVAFIYFFEVLRIKKRIDCGINYESLLKSSENGDDVDSPQLMLLACAGRFVLAHADIGTECLEPNLIFANGTKWLEQNSWDDMRDLLILKSHTNKIETLLNVYRT